ncbi:MAG: hypothetical protein JNK67_24135 [Alphaproteobacteria bacterium]|nr:hypothetical protein [Alphaproteobacteria bacterium]
MRISTLGIGRLAGALAGILAAAAIASAEPTRSGHAVVAFRSPSGNVHCVIDATPGQTATAACELRDYSGPAPVKPADCELDWVAGASLDAKGAVALFACQGDTIQDPRSRSLEYGAAITLGGITCSSATTGITCKLGSGRGFLVSRALIRRL